MEKKKRWDILVWSFSVTYLQVYNLPLFPVDNFISLSTFSSLKPLPLNLNIVSKISIVSCEFNLSNLWPSKNEDGLLPSQFGNVNESENWKVCPFMSTSSHWAGLLSAQMKYLPLLIFHMVLSQTQCQTHTKECYSKCPEPSFASPWEHKVISCCIRVRT